MWHCFCQAVAALPYCCNSSWLAPPQAKWGNSVLSTTLNSTGLAQGFTKPCFGRLACCRTLALCLCSLPHLPFLRVLLLAPPSFSEVGSVIHLTPTDSGTLQVTVYASQFCSGWGFNLPRDCTVLFSQAVGGEVTCGVCCSPVGQLWNWPVERNGVPLFLRQTPTATGFNLAGQR
jgi:hypothetical protein